MARARSIKSALSRTAHQSGRIAVPAPSFGVEIASNTKVDLVFDDACHHLSDAERLTRFIAESSAEFVLAMSADVAIETDGWVEMLAIVMQEREVAALSGRALCRWRHRACRSDCWF